MTDESPDPAQVAKAPAGWYPHPSMVDTQRYWDGEKWTDQVAPMPSARPSTGFHASVKSALAVLALAGALAILGLGIRPEDGEALDSIAMDRAASSSFGGAAIFALIGLIMLASALMKRDES